MASVHELLDIQRRQLHAISERGVVERLKRPFSRARDELEAKLAQLAARGESQTFTAYTAQQMLYQVRDALRAFDRDFRQILAAEGTRVSELSSAHLLRGLRMLEKRYRGTYPVLQSERAGVFSRVFEEVEAALLERYQQSVTTYGPNTIRAIEKELTQSALQNETIYQATQRIAGTNGLFQGQRWRAERIARTEMAYSYGVTKQQAMRAVRDTDYPNLQKKLIATFDTRTGDDSKELHGQTVGVDEPFVWHRKNSKGVVVETIRYMYPPNRPNDREIVVPWRPEWKNTEFTEPLDRGGRA